MLDTNVFVGAGFNPRSASARLIAAAREGGLILVWAEETRAETRRILEKIPPLDWPAAAPLFTEAGRFDGPLDLAAMQAVPDPEDRKFAALSAAADVPVVSSDSDLLDVRGVIGAVVLTPGEAAKKAGL
ncbi:PIN domain-containing protein [Euryhalocaulis sp.]|uniref:PIN domain-containing protein n=1 Tax=Euryhalocaulis sp. TaxID=2744307 RepID=UPI00257BD32D|nr:PIN domain-containing protein [Euryhalocaulis sp.]